MKLKKGILLLSIGFGSVSSIIAQSDDNSTDNYVRPQSGQPAASSSNIVSFGVGMGGYYPYMGNSSVENPNLTLMYENAVLKNAGPGNVSLGGLLSYKSIYSSYQDYYTEYNYEQRWNYYIVGTRVSYHIKPLSNKNIELYAGAMIGYYITTFKFTSNDPNYSEPDDPGYSLTANNSPNFFALSLYAGVRSWISPHSSVWLELGYGYTSFSFGASYKI